MFNFLFDLIGTVLATFYELVPDYAFAIIGLTLVVMVITTPLTLKSTRSMMLMQQLQPEMKKLQSQYKDDRQKLNEELMKFYKENNLSPAGGCLPMIVQMPVFFVLYQVLRGMTLRVSDMGHTVGHGLGQLGSGVGLDKATVLHQNFHPMYLSDQSKLFQDLSAHNTMVSFGIDLAESASESLSRSLTAAIPHLVLIVVVFLTGFYQQRQIQGRNPNAEVNPQQQMLMKVMPFFLPVISFGLPSGLVLYFVVSNLFRVGLQGYISRSIYGIKKGVNPALPAGGGAGATVPAKPKPAGSGGATAAAKRPAKGGRVTPKVTRDDAETPSSAPATVGGFRQRLAAAAGDTGSNRRDAAAGTEDSKPDKSSQDATKPAKSAKPARAASSNGTAPDNGAANGTKTKNAQTSGKGTGEAPTPTLQPRARKPKKR